MSFGAVKVTISKNIASATVHVFDIAADGPADHPVTFEVLEALRPDLTSEIIAWRRGRAEGEREFGNG